MNKLYTSLLSLFAVVTRFEIKVSFYVTRFIFQNKVGFSYLLIHLS